MLIIGGYSQNGPLSSVELLDIKSGRWEELPDLPNPRYGHACLLMELAGKEGVLVNPTFLQIKYNFNLKCAKVEMIFFPYLFRFLEVL